MGTNRVAALYWSNVYRSNGVRICVAALAVKHVLVKWTREKCKKGTRSKKQIPMQVRRGDADHDIRHTYQRAELAMGWQNTYGDETSPGMMRIRPSLPLLLS